MALMSSYTWDTSSFDSWGTAVAVAVHLRFKHAQPKMCHSPKVDDGVEIYFLFS